MALHRWKLKAENNLITIEQNFYLFSLLKRNYLCTDLKKIEIKEINPGGIKQYKFYQLFLIFQVKGFEKREMIYSSKDYSVIKETEQRISKFFHI